MCIIASYNGRTILVRLEQTLQEQQNLQHPDPRARQRRQDHAPLPDVRPSPARSLGKAVETTPTIGSNVEEIAHKNIKLSAWDLGGQERIRSIWSTYYSRTDAVIFVIDSTDLKGEVIAKTELFKVVINEVPLRLVRTSRMCPSWSSPGWAHP